MKTSVIVRKKGNPNAPLITATVETVDLNTHDVLDEHGDLVGEEVLDEIRKLQAPPSPSAVKPPVARHAPPVPTHNAPHEPPKKK